MREVYARGGEELDIGRRGENLATRVIFDVAEWESLYGEGIFHLLHRRNGDKYPYPVVTAYEPGRVIWDVSKTDLAVVGKGLAELQYWAGETRVKSAVFSTRTATSLDNEGPVPDEPEASWVEKILAAAEAVLKGSVPPGSGDSGSGPDSGDSEGGSGSGDSVGGEVGEPVAYLYGEDGEDKVRLPDIYKVYTPELQKTYPFAVLHFTEYTESITYWLWIFDQQPYWRDTANMDFMVFPDGTDGWGYPYDPEEDSGWPVKSIHGEAWYAGERPFWSNFNVLNEDGSVFLAASEPVPVYE